MPAAESTMPALMRAQREHVRATPNHRRIIARADRALDLFEEYKAEAEFLRKQQPPPRR